MIGASALGAADPRGGRGEQERQGVCDDEGRDDGQHDDAQGVGRKQEQGGRHEQAPPRGDPEGQPLRRLGRGVMQDRKQAAPDLAADGGPGCRGTQARPQGPGGPEFDESHNKTFRVSRQGDPLP